MKKIIIGTLVGTVIYFAFQAIMWEGGFHKDFTLYAAKQDTILKVLDTSLNRDGLYMMPMADVNSPDFKAQQQTIEKQMVGRPWAMVFYHRAMAEFSPAFLIMGIIYTLLSCFLVCCVLYYAGFKSFWSRVLIAMAFSVFALITNVFPAMNWWSFPWTWIKPQVIDLVFGWGLTSIWLAFFVKKIVPPPVPAA